MAEEQVDSRKRLKSLVFRALKATIKGAVFYAIYFFIWSFIAPMASAVPELQATVETFVAVYITLMIIGELTAGTIYQHFFNAAKALFVIAYLILSLKGGIVGMTYEGVALTIDLRLFLAFAILLSLLGLMKSILGGINFLSEKAEQTHLRQMNIEAA